MGCAFLIHYVIEQLLFINSFGEMMRIQLTLFFEIQAS